MDWVSFFLGVCVGFFLMAIVEAARDVWGSGDW